MKSFIYYFLQLTYGILMNAIGFIVFSITLLFTHNVSRHYHSFVTYTKTRFGGLSLGMFTITSEHDTHILNHEFGHSYQNIMFGPLFPFIVGLPSSIRYWYFTWADKHHKEHNSYESIWFEAQATNIGTKVYNKWSDENDKERSKTAKERRVR